MMDYCEVCGREVETKIITQKEIFNVCGEDIEVDAQVMVCAECGEELFNEELDSATLVLRDLIMKSSVRWFCFLRIRVQAC